MASQNGLMSLFFTSGTQFLCIFEIQSCNSRRFVQMNLAFGFGLVLFPMRISLLKVTDFHKIIFVILKTQTPPSYSRIFKRKSLYRNIGHTRLFCVIFVGFVIFHGGIITEKNCSYF